MMMYRGAFLAGIGLLALEACARADDLPPPAAILRQLHLVNRHFMAEWPDPGKVIVVNAVRRPSNIWTRAVYFEGLMALRGIDRDVTETQYATAWGDAHHWGLRGGVHTRDADNECCGQTYLELFQGDRVPERIRDIQANIDELVAGSRVDDWWWVDALQMAMPVYAKLGVLTHNRADFEKMHACYVATRDGVPGRPGLFNPRAGLWWRDARFVPPAHNPNGGECYWSRGNGWAMAAMVRVLDVLPREAPGRDDYVGMLRTMAAAVKAVQRPDGFWNPSLRDAQNFAGKESSGTSLFTYAIAGGIRLGLLPAPEYRPVVARAWAGLAADAVRPDGSLGFVQGTGAQPSDGQPVTYDSHPDFDDFGVGCFLLAGSEVYPLAQLAP